TAAEKFRSVRSRGWMPGSTGFRSISSTSSCVRFEPTSRRTGLRAARSWASAASSAARAASTAGWSAARASRSSRAAGWLWAPASCARAPGHIVTSASRPARTVLVIRARQLPQEMEERRRLLVSELHHVDGVEGVPRFRDALEEPPTLGRELEHQATPIALVDAAGDQALLLELRQHVGDGRRRQVEGARESLGM